MKGHQQVTDARLPHRIADWGRAQSTTPTPNDADAIVAWLRAPRGGCEQHAEYARKPADALRRQVARVLASNAKAGEPTASPAAAAPAAVTAGWSIDPSPSAGAKRPAAAPAAAPTVPREKVARSAPAGGANLLNASLRASYTEPTASDAAAAAALAAAAATLPAAPAAAAAASASTPAPNGEGSGTATAAGGAASGGASSSEAATPADES